MKHKFHILLILFFILGPFVVKAQDLPAVCGGSRIRYGVTGMPGSVYNWQVTGGTIISNYNDSVDVQWNNTPGIHTIIYQETSAFGCTGPAGTGYVMIMVPQLDLGPTKRICRGESITLDAGEGFISYLWNSGLTSRTIDVSSTGTYWVEARDISQCIARDTVNVIVNSLPVVNLGNDTSICAPGYKVLDAGNPGASYFWSNGNASPTYTAEEGSGTVWVRVTDNNKCSGSDTITILPCYAAIVLPNAFTPGSGVKNEVFRLDVLREQYPRMTVKIYDRWGRLVFQSDPGYNTPWDGTSKGKPLPMDTYYYIITPGDGSKDIYGSVAIIR